jgi:hypothetical protein
MKAAAIPIGLTLEPSFVPQKSKPFAMWVDRFHDELKGLWKLYRKQYKDEVSFPEFCLYYFKSHRDILEPNLN